jgi:hypothetical protein
VTFTSWYGGATHRYVHERLLRCRSRELRLDGRGWECVRLLREPGLANEGCELARIGLVEETRRNATVVFCRTVGRVELPQELAAAIRRGTEPVREGRCDLLHAQKGHAIALRLMTDMAIENRVAEGGRVFVNANIAPSRKQFWREQVGMGAAFW